MDGGKASPGDRNDSAWQALFVRTRRDAVAARGLPPQPHDDLVHGRVAQAHGLEGDAAASYRRAAGDGEAAGAADDERAS